MSEPITLPVDVDVRVNVRTSDPIPPSFVVDLGARIFASIMSSTQVNATLLAVMKNQNLPEDASVGDCTQALAKNCIDYAQAYARAANEYLLNEAADEASKA